MGYKDPDKQREYQRKWIANRRATYLLGKVCIDCGTKEDLEFDHLDPSTKWKHNFWSYSPKRIEAELEKCVVRCKTHHLEKTLKNKETSKFGENNSRVTETDETVSLARELYESGLTAKEVSDELGLNYKTVWDWLHRTRRSDTI